jgi:hypothetical protein
MGNGLAFPRTPEPELAGGGGAGGGTGKAFENLDLGRVESLLAALYWREVAISR